MTNPGSTTSTVPMTVSSPLQSNFTLALAIGDNYVARPTPNQPNSYWIVIVDRTTLDVVSNFWWSTPDTAPDVSSYDDPKYMLIVVGYALTTPNVPTGDFYDFLIDNGAGVGIKRAIQVYQQLGCGSFGGFAYTLIGQLGPGPATDYIGIEGVSVMDDPSGVVTTVELVGIDVNGTTTYSPSPLSP